MSTHLGKCLEEWRKKILGDFDQPETESDRAKEKDEVRRSPGDGGVVSPMRKQRQHVQRGISERPLSSSRRAQTIPGSDKEHSPDSISWVLDTLVLMVEKRYSNLSLTTFNQWCQSIIKGWIDWKTVNSSFILYSVISMCCFHKPKSTKNGMEQMFTHVLMLFREIPNGGADTDCVTHMLPLMSSHK